MTDILDRITEAIGCHQCQGPLGDSPSDDFCGELCWERWHAQHGKPLELPPARARATRAPLPPIRR